MKFKVLIITFFLLISFIGTSQEIPKNSVISNANLIKYLKADVKKKLQSENGQISEAVLANYFREKYAERYFYNYKNFDQRFVQYNQLYPEAKENHLERALNHISKFSDVTPWKLPFNFLNGSAVNAYEMRHLARQHKMVDVSFQYHYSNKNKEYLSYFKNQLTSLNTALESNKYETIEDGNGVFEAFRSGYRVLNWLQIHSFFLNEKEYSDADQLTTIATILQHGANLYDTNQEFVPGNHQTRGMSALAMLSILFRDFEGTDLWYNRSMQLLEEHLSKEINDDGFQFERSVHYHMSDIDNYYYVYQLAKISTIEVNDFWTGKLKSLFTTLVKISYPDGSAPVLQDDTDNPWSEKNDISSAVTLGYLLFEDAEMGYFAKNYVEPKLYWYLNDYQLNKLNKIDKKQPEIKSVLFPTTGYYIFREGWQPTDKMLIISAEVDKEKPDHQHGDILGIQAMANGKVILPNYQVRYSLADYEFFKNSMVKNVALVDDELQGKKYKGNQGGSGFGKFGELPKPTVISWETGGEIEYFVGSHDGFKNVGVDYSRQVISVANEFWIVKDNFKSDKAHTYKQVWQGHYSQENQPNLLRATFDDATGLDIYQILPVDTVTSAGARGKNWSVVAKNNQQNFSFATIVYPYKGFEARINETFKNPSFKGWKLNESSIKIEGEKAFSISKQDNFLVFSTKKFTLSNLVFESDNEGDFYIKIQEGKVIIQNIGACEISALIKGKIVCVLNGNKTNNSLIVKPGSVLECSGL